LAPAFGAEIWIDGGVASLRTHERNVVVISNGRAEVAQGAAA
jgi:hypothetical protein